MGGFVLHSHIYTHAHTHIHTYTDTYAQEYRQTTKNTILDSMDVALKSLGRKPTDGRELIKHQNEVFPS